MTFRNVTVVTVAVAAAFALGVWSGPYLKDVGERTSVVGTEQASAEKAAPVRTVRPRATRTPRAEAPVPTIAASEPLVHKQLKPVLNLGTNMKIASEGFDDAEQFAAVAYAARNTKVPFMVLKHRVLDEKKTLAAAIAESKPDLDADREARRARAEARESLVEVRHAMDLADGERPRG